jgi:hypothetical protein
VQLNLCVLFCFGFVQKLDSSISKQIFLNITQVNFLELILTFSLIILGVKMWCHCTNHLRICLWFWVPLLLFILIYLFLKKLILIVYFNPKCIGLLCSLN